MKVRVFKRKDGLFDVLCQPNRETGLKPIVTLACDKAKAKAAVAEVGGEEERIREQLRQVKIGGPRV